MLSFFFCCLDGSRHWLWGETHFVHNVKFLSDKHLPFADQNFTLLFLILPTWIYETFSPSLNYYRIMYCDSWMLPSYFVETGNDPSSLWRRPMYVCTCRVPHTTWNCFGRDTGGRGGPEVVPSLTLLCVILHTVDGTVLSRGKEGEETPGLGLRPLLPPPLLGTR